MSHSLLIWSTSVELIGLPCPETTLILNLWTLARHPLYNKEINVCPKRYFVHLHLERLLVLLYLIASFILVMLFCISYQLPSKIALRRMN